MDEILMEFHSKMNYVPSEVPHSSQTCMNTSLLVPRSSRSRMNYAYLVQYSSQRMMNYAWVVADAGLNNCIYEVLAFDAEHASFLGVPEYFS